jgi:peptidoglycan biosynthesis protein MviN/MurJ (putative lipid II flippase)
VTDPAEPPAEDPSEKTAEELAVPLRWLGRSVVVALALWLIMDGLRETWAPAGAIATVLVWVGWTLVVAFAAVATTYMARRGRSG